MHYTNPRLLYFTLLLVKFPDISRFSRQVVTLCFATGNVGISHQLIIVSMTVISATVNKLKRSQLFVQAIPTVIYNNKNNCFSDRDVRKTNSRFRLVF